MNKRGFLFTALALVFVLVIITIASTQDLGYPRAVSEAQRIATMDRYLTNLEADLPRAAYIAGFRSLIATEEHVSTTGVYLTSFDDTFQEVFENGTINGTHYDDDTGIMFNSTFTNFTQRFASLASRQGMIANLSVISLHAYQKDPWHVTLDVNVSASLSDTGYTARFNRTLQVEAAVPIEGIKDPVYEIGTQGRVVNTLNQSNVSRPYIDSNNITTNLQLLVNQSLYVNSSAAPDFIHRFMGNFSPSQYGIMSLVNIKELVAQGFIPNHCKSVVDYLYFGSGSTTNFFIVNMDQSTFWLDSAHFTDLDATGKSIGPQSCP